MLTSLIRNPFIRFIVTGGIAAGVNIGSRVLLSLYMSFEIAVVVAYLFGMTTAYILARLFVFESSGQAVHHEYMRFALVNMVALAQVWLISVGLANWLFPLIGFTWHPDLVAHMIGVTSPVFTSYYGHKLFTFKRTASKS